MALETPAEIIERLQIERDRERSRCIETENRLDESVSNNAILAQQHAELAADFGRSQKNLESLQDAHGKLLVDRDQLREQLEEAGQKILQLESRLPGRNTNARRTAAEWAEDAAERMGAAPAHAKTPQDHGEWIERLSPCYRIHRSDGYLLECRSCGALVDLDEDLGPSRQLRRALSHARSHGK